MSWLRVAVVPAVAVLLLLPCVRPPARAGSNADPADLDALRAAGIADDDAALLAFFRQRTAHAEPAAVQQWITQLAEQSFAVRREACRNLVALGGRAVPALQQARKHPDPEVQHLAEECLRDIQHDPATPLVAAAARVLAVRRPGGAAAVLLDYIPAVVDDDAAEAVRSALAALALRDGQPDPAILGMLTAAEPAQRGAAGVALCRAGVQEQLPAVRKLLADADPFVRLHVGLALAARRDSAAVGALISVLDVLPRNHLWKVEDLLYRLADDKAPAVGMGETAESRQKFRQAWEGWWQAAGGTADLTRLDTTPYLDRTLLVLLDAGRVMELDADDTPRWRIDQLGYPLDVQMLPGERVLIAEHNSNRVTERHTSGVVLWEQHVEEPIVAQRLPNGHTFIAGPWQLLEVDREDNVVFSFHVPADSNDKFMRAVKLPSGDVACVTFSQRYRRLNAQGKELAGFPVSVYTSGGRLDVLPDGRVLIPQMRNNQVVEYDAEGKVLREIPVDEPIVASRLPNGNVLVTSMSRLRAVEIDPVGKEVWEYRSTTSRVTRAYRH
jgi:HEAT repeat protein